MWHRNIKVDSTMKKYSVASTNGDETISPAMPSQLPIPTLSANPGTESLVAFNNSCPVVAVSSLQTPTESSKGARL